ncbi:MULTISPECIES: sensor histidine kinase [Marichromatium]|uniref:histidine kinase n=1 Tax=Marichromatium gracile TaxID=1048 RepID=A0A4R4AGM3_MARGR|nr:signal transduction histidine kinase [Marichromatium gracile]
MSPMRLAQATWSRARRRVGRILHSSIFRLALLHVLLACASAAILLGFIYWSTAGYMDRQTDATIAAEVRGLAEQYRQRGLAGLRTLIEERIRRDPSGASVYLLVDARRQWILGNLDRWPADTPDESGWVRFRLRERGPDDVGAAHAARARVFRLRGGLRLLVGRDIRELEATRTLIERALYWGVAMTAALALLGGWLMSAGVVRRLEAINHTSREIMAGDLARRIPLGGSDDDFDQLARNLNQMLDRIEGLMAGVRQVSDNIAHDLRTPLTRLRTRLELLAAALDDPEAARALAETAIADADELLATFNALLRIARIESGGRRAAFAPVALAALLEDLRELYEPVAAERGQRLTLEIAAPATLAGDRDLLFQALANLVDNAIKYGPPEGAIVIRLDTRDGAPCIGVADDGPGIPEALREAVFRRFFRADDSRSTPGSGLGLSLVRAVAELHRARVVLEDNRPGLRALLYFAAPPQG